MLQVIAGPPGSGKSYFSCNYLYQFCTYDALYHEYVVADHVLFITNIEGFKPRHWSLHKCLDLTPDEKLSACDRDKLKQFFSIENFEAIQKKTRKTHIILMIDEAHELFPSGFAERSVYEFFAYHRHIGLDCFFMTQGIESLSRMFNPLFEYVVKALPRSKKVGNTFVYTYTDLKGKFLYSKYIPQKKKVFGIYKSFRHDEQNKPKSAVVVWGVMVICVMALAGFLFKAGFSSIDEKAETKQALNSSISDIASRVNPASVTPVPVQVEPEKKSVKDEALSKSWRVQDVQGFIENHATGQRMYLIDGKRFAHDDERFRNFDRFGQTIEILTYDQAPQAPGTTLGAQGQAVTASGAQSPEAASVSVGGAPSS